MFTKESKYIFVYCQALKLNNGKYITYIYELGIQNRTIDIDQC